MPMCQRGAIPGKRAFHGFYRGNSCPICHPSTAPKAPALAQPSTASSATSTTDSVISYPKCAKCKQAVLAHDARAGAVCEGCTEFLICPQCSANWLWAGASANDKCLTCKSDAWAATKREGVETRNRKLRVGNGDEVISRQACEDKAKEYAKSILEVDNILNSKRRSIDDITKEVATLASLSREGQIIMLMVAKWDIARAKAYDKAVAGPDAALKSLGNTLDIIAAIAEGPIELMKRLLSLDLDSAEKEAPERVKAWKTARGALKRSWKIAQAKGMQNQMADQSLPIDKSLVKPINL
jgi:hypothetical protein